jgi:hypothetical protein
MLCISSSVPMIEPMTVIFLLTRRSKFALGIVPRGAPTVTNRARLKRRLPSGLSHIVNDHIDPARQLFVEAKRSTRRCSALSSTGRAARIVFAPYTVKNDMPTILVAISAALH